MLPLQVPVPVYKSSYSLFHGPDCAMEVSVRHSLVCACRQGTSDEVALLVAEFGLLDQQLASLGAAVQQDQAILITEEELIPVASEIPDMRSRLGIA